MIASLCPCLIVLIPEVIVMLIRQCANRGRFIGGGLRLGGGFGDVRVVLAILRVNPVEHRQLQSQRNGL